MTRKDYKAIAEAIRTSTHRELSDQIIIDPAVLAERIATIMAQDNPHFDRVKFLEACGL